MLKSTYKTAEAANANEPLPAGWTEHKAPTGHSYYYNSETKQSTYTRPTEPSSAPLDIDYNATRPEYVKLSRDQSQQFPVTSHFDPWQNGERSQGHFRGGRSYQDRSRRRQEDRPKTKAAIPNCTPWLLVKTKYGRRFVHNTETKESFWKFPQNVMMAVIEMDRLEWEANKEEEKAAPRIQDQDSGAAAPRREAPVPNDEEDSDSYEEIEVTDDEDELDPASKRPRTGSPEKSPGPVEFDEDDIAFQLAQMGEEYGLDPGEYDNPDDAYMGEDDQGLELSADDAAGLFNDLLDDFKVNPYTTFDKVIEDGHIVDDNRYTVLPNMARRREVFDKWSRERIASLQKERAKERGVEDDPKVEYLRFLSEHATTKLFWVEFKRKYRKEDVMKNVNVSEKEKEKLYRDLIARLKASESDRRKELGRLLKEIPLHDLSRRTAIDSLPEGLQKDIRYWAVPMRARDDLVEVHIATLPDPPT